MKLRPYQQATHDRCFELWEEYQSLICVLATAMGKTIVFSHIIKTFLARNPNSKVMVLAERDKIVTQGCKTIGDITGKRVEIEMASHHVDMRGMFAPDIVIGTVQTQARGGDGLGRLGKFDPMDFGLLVVDECVAGDTLITMADGKKRTIRDIYEDNRVCEVQSWDFTTGRSCVSKVIGRKRSFNKTVVRMETHNNDHLVCTPDHQVWTKLGWKGVRSLNTVWDDVYTSSWQWRSPRPIIELSENTTVYDIEVEHTHCYFANGILVHNCHHAVAPQYRKLLDYYSTNPNLRILGVTATPDRHDKQALGKVFQYAASDFDIQYGCDEGWLMYPYQSYAVVASLDISHVGKVGDDFNAGELETELVKDKPVIEIARAAIDHCGDKKTIIFCVGVNQAQRLCDLINSVNFKPGSACFICGKTDKTERERIVNDFKRGKYQYLCNVGIAVEGWDDPEVAFIVDAAPTLSRAKYTQKLGRMLRPAAEIAHALNDCTTADERKAMIAASSKPKAVYIDLAMNSGRLKPIFIGDILGGNYSDEVRERARKKAVKAGEKGEAVDMADMLAKAEAELKREKDRQAVRRANLKAKAEYRLEQIDPFNVYDIRRSQPSSTAPREAKALTEKQRAILEKQGVRGLDSMPYDDAKAILDRIIYGWQHNLASYRQQAQLTKFGYPPAPYTREQATALLQKEYAKRQAWRTLNRT